MVACDEHNGIVGKTRLLDSCEYLVNHHVNLITAVAIEIIIGCRVYIIVEFGIVGKGPGRLEAGVAILRHFVAMCQIVEQHGEEGLA